jgi:heme oxygenase (biliverdin-IX-beta and delta-forming)
MGTLTAELAPLPRSKRLKAATEGTHDRLDQRIMAARPFADRTNYGRFLAVQHAFHTDLAPLYADPRLAAFISDLEARNRLASIVADLADLDLPVPDAPPGSSPLPDAGDVPTALGWLYVAEGSNLGAAFLFKAAAAIGLDGNFGARHLAGHPDGRAQHWRSFTAALDGIDLSEDQEECVVAGCRAAFERVHALVGHYLA